MNVSELSRALQEQADELDARGLATQLPRVHSRIKTTRRRRVTAVALGAVIIGAATAVAITLPGRADRDTAPVAPVHDPLVFPADLGDYHLVASEVGQPGDNRISVTVPRPPGGFTILPACSGPEGDLDTRLAVNGTSVGGVTCSPHPVLENPGWLVQDLTGNGVDLEPQSMTITLTLVRGRFNQQRTDDPGTVLGVSVYQADQDAGR